MWAERTAWVLSHRPDAAALLTDAECRRAAGFRHAAAADSFVAAHALVRMCAAGTLRTTAERLTVAQHCPTCGGPHGPPHLIEEPALAISLAHSRRHVAAAAGTGRLGVDIEQVDPGAALPDLVLTPTEQALVAASTDPSVLFAGLWVRKEALVKAGVATLDTLATVDAGADGHGLLVRYWHDGAGLAVGCASTSPADLTSHSLALTAGGPGR